MISASAPSLSQYIPNFQEKFTKCSQIIDSLIAVFQGVPMIIKNSLPQIDETNAQNHQIGALIHLTELVKIDIIKFTNETPVSTQQSLFANFRTNGLSIYQYLFALLGGSSGGIPAAMQKVSTVNPSLLDLLQLCDFFIEATEHATTFIQFLAQLEYADAASILSQSFVTKKNTQIPSIASMKNVDKVAFVAQKKSQYTVRCPQTRSPSSQPSASIDKSDAQQTTHTCALVLIVLATTCVVCGQKGIDLLHTIIAQCFSITNQSCQALQAGRR